MAHGYRDTTKTHYSKGGPVGGLKGAAKVGRVMKEFKSGKLHSGSKSGPEVTNPKQAVAIALSEARKAAGKCAGGRVGYASGGAVKDPNAKPAAYARGADNERIREVQHLAKGGLVGEGREKTLLKVRGPLGDKLRSIEAKEQGVMRRMVGKGVPAHSDRPLIGR